MPDYEILELILFGAFRQGDTKPLANRLVKHFNTLSGVLSAKPEELKKVKGCGPASVAVLKVAHEAGRRLLRQEMKAADTLGSFEAVVAYCRATMGMDPMEQFRLIFLNTQNMVIDDEVQQRGTVNHTPVYTREVVKRALELNASALIMVHNHPSGDPTPSRPDIEMTKKVQEALAAVGITLHDHLIIGRGRHLSFRSERLL